MLERVAALCAVSHEALLTAGGKLLLRNGDVTGLVSICIYGGSTSCALRAWALPELLPRLGSAAVALLLDDLRAETLTTDGQMLIARGLLRAEQTAPAISWATAAQSAGLPCAAEALGEVALDAPRALRACDLDLFVAAAQQQAGGAGHCMKTLGVHGQVVVYYTLAATHCATHCVPTCIHTILSYTAY